MWLIWFIFLLSFGANTAFKIRTQNITLKSLENSNIVPTFGEQTDFNEKNSFNSPAPALLFFS